MSDTQGASVNQPDASIRETCRPPPFVQIGNRLIGASEAVYIIAEAGVNHDGDVTLAHELVQAACDAGADAVKFQVFSADRLVDASAPTCGYQKAHDRAASQREMLRRLELKAEALRDLKARADRLGIDFLATPFGSAELKSLVDLGVPAIKFASSDLVNVPLLTAGARSGLPMIVSTGASDLAEIDAAVRLINRSTPHGKQRPQSGRLILLHCVSAYPTDPNIARLSCIRTLARRFTVPVGFSDHTSEPTFSGLAVAAGAVLLEKHLTLDRGASGPDHFFSLSPEQFAQYVEAARHARAALGDGTIRVAPEEQEVRELARGSIVSVGPIRAGQLISSDDVGIRRPGGGIEPARWNDVVGRVARTDIPPNVRLSFTMLQ